MKRVVPTQCRGRRRGLIILIAMVALFVGSAVALSVVQMAVHQRRQLQLEQQRLQASWLAESGIDRAIAAIAVNPQYTGDTWNIAADELGGRPATVEIRVESGESPAVQAVARYPSDSARRAQVTKRIQLRAPAETSSNGSEPQ